MKKNKGLIIGIIVLTVIVLTLGGVLVFKKINGDNAEIKELSKKTLEESITLNVKDEYKDAIELTKDSNFVDPLDMVSISVNGTAVDPKTATGDTTVTSDVSLIDTSKNGAYTVKYTVVTHDEYEQEVTKEFSQIYTVKDTQKPEIILVSESVTINNAQSYDPSSNVTVNDNHDSISKVNALSNGIAGFVVEGDLNNSVAGTYTMTVKAKDADDNYADEKTFTVTVKAASNTNTDNNSKNNTDNNSGNTSNNGDDDTLNTMNAETYKVSQAIDESIKIRSGAGTSYSQIQFDALSASTQNQVNKGSDGYAYLNGNDTFTVYKVSQDSAGNTWGRIDAEINAWVCIKYGDETWASVQ